MNTTRLKAILASSLAFTLSASLHLAAHTAEPAKPDAHAPAAKALTPATVAPSATAPASTAKLMGQQVLEAIEADKTEGKRLTLVVNGKEKKFITIPARAPEVPAEAPAKAAEHANAPAAAPRRAPAAVNPRASRQYIRAKAATLASHEAGAAQAAPPAGDAHWSYEGENGPAAWGKLKSDFNVCALGKRQSPINIEDSSTLRGPAEPLQFNYTPSSGSVVNNGHTIQVDLYGDNSVTVRGSTYKLLQFHFHTPSEEQINYRNFSMVAHLVHKNAEGQLAVIAVLLDPGAANALIDKVWTYMPLDTGDRVSLPIGIIDINELLPKDQRYYQFMGSLTTPPCTEGVLWMVLKQPTSLSKEQIKLFTQLFPRNARPVQPVNGRTVRNAQ